MQIDWFTFIAQILNFLILVALLKRFLYAPIMQAMNQREYKIAASLQAADAKAATAQQEIEHYHQLQQDWQQEQETLRSQVKVEVETLKQTLLQQAREEVARTQYQWQESLRQQQEAFLKHVRNATTQQVYGVIRRALADLAHADLEQQMIAVFLEQLKTLSGEKQQELSCVLAQEIEAGSEQMMVPITIQSAFAIPEVTRQQIEKAVRDRLTQNVHLRFEVVPELMGGIELKADGYKLAWSLDNYLTSLEEQLSHTLEGESGNHERNRQPTARGTG